MPAASPSHHVSQIPPYCDSAAYPARVRLVTPMVALTVVLTSAASPAKAKMSRARSNAAAPRAYRVTRSDPATASSVLPAAMPRDVAAEPAVVMLTANAAAKMAGHTPRPRTSMAARAIPAGGHTGVALAWTEAKCSPTLPATA